MRANWGRLNRIVLLASLAQKEVKKKDTEALSRIITEITDKAVAALRDTPYHDEQNKEHNHGKA